MPVLVGGGSAGLAAVVAADWVGGGLPAVIAAALGFLVAVPWLPGRERRPGRARL
jgi:L-lactate permease